MSDSDISQQPTAEPDRDALSAWVENALRKPTSPETIFCHLVAAGLSTEEADQMLRAMQAGQRWDFKESVATEEARMASGRQSAFWPLAIGFVSLLIGLGTWIGTYAAVVEQGGTYYIPHVLIVFGAIATLIGVRRLLAKRNPRRRKK